MSRRRTIALGIVACAAALVSYRAPMPPDGSFDGSWRYVLAAAQAHGLVFGRDLVYPYGPAGWLGVPLATPYHHAALLVFLTVMALLCGAAVARVASRSDGIVRAGVAALLALGAFAFRWTHGPPGIEPDYQLIFVAFVALVTVRPDSRWFPFACGVAGAAAGLASGIKIVAATDIVTLTVVALLVALRSGRRSVVLGAAAALAAFAVTASLSLGSTILHGSLLPFIRGSLDVSSGYAAAMADASSPGEARAALAAFALGIAVLGVSAARGRWRLALLGGALLVLGWKHATIREDLSHAGYLYATLALVMATVVASRARRGLAIGAAILGFVSLAHLATLYVVYHHPAPPALPAFDSSARYAHRTMDVLPDAAAIALRTRGSYDPLPMFQLETAYTPYLDRIDAEALDARGAAIVLYRFTTIDDRYPFGDAPAVVRGLLCRYRSAGDVVEDGTPMIELRRSTDRCVRDGETGTNPGTGVRSLPALAAGEFIVARATLRLSLRGRFDAIAGRIEPPHIVLRMRDGTQLRRRIVAATLADGVVIDPAPSNQSEAAAIFRGSLGGNVRTFSIDPGSSYTLGEIRLERYRQGEVGRSVAK